MVNKLLGIIDNTARSAGGRNVAVVDTICNKAVRRANNTAGTVTASLYATVVYTVDYSILTEADNAAVVPA